jgi:flagellar motor switch protein FliN/FliY
MATTDTPGNDYQQFADSSFISLMKGMTEATGSEWQIATPSDTDANATGSETMRIRVALDGGLKGEYSLEFARSEAANVASKYLKKTVEESDQELPEAMVRVVKLGTDLFVSSLRDDHGAVTVEASSVPAAESDAADVIRITMSSGDEDRLSISMYLDASLKESLTRHSQKLSEALEGDRKRQGASSTGAVKQVNLSLVMDVELNVTLRFGRRQLPLREVLELTTGSVVELDRQVEEPVELLLDGIVIARGEAVVVDGNYGLRVTEVLKPGAAPYLSHYQSQEVLDRELEQELTR